MTPARFQALWQRLTGQPPGHDLFPRLLAAYSEPHRAYHNVAHIDDCLKQFDPCRHLAKIPDEVEAAIYFHDAIYDPHAADNEERSSQWSVDALTDAGADPHSIQRIGDLILATKHLAAPATQDAALHVDVDLSILGRDEAIFDAYDQAIREEYAWVPESTFRRERAKILQRFLDHPTLYHLSHFRDRYEKQARRNLNRAIEGLTRDERA